jgi:putative transposase
VIARCFIAEGYTTQVVLPLCGLSRSSYYYRQRRGRRGRHASTVTAGPDGIVSNAVVAGRIEELLQQEFVDYGYQKVAAWLRDEGFVINRKKVYRLMKERRFLNSRIGIKRQGKTIAAALLPNPAQACEHLQTDIKYIHIRGKRRNALLLTVLDVYSRGVLGYRLAWNIKKEQVVDLMKEVLYDYRLPEKVSLRTDNGSQFEAGLFREYCREMEIEHEFTHVASPQENCYIESFHSIIEATVCRRYEFGSLEEAEAVINRFMNFYNQDRLHAGLSYRSPQKFLKYCQSAISLRLLACRTAGLEQAMSINPLVESLSYL